MEIAWSGGVGLKQQVFITHGLEAGESKIKVPADSVSGGEDPAAWFIRRWPASCCTVSRGGRGDGALWGSLLQEC